MYGWEDVDLGGMPESMIEQTAFKRQIFRAALRHVSPMVIRVISVSDRMNMPDFNDIFSTMKCKLQILCRKCTSYTRRKSLAHGL